MTSPHPAPRSRKKVVKAYGIGSFPSGTMIRVFTLKDEAEIAFEKYWGKQFKLIPVTITYTLPTIKSSKRRRKV